MENTQAALWNGVSGKTWVESQDLINGMLRPFQDLLVERVPPNARRVLDVGCGTGSTTLAIAKQLAKRNEAGTATGVDISEPMIAAARTRAEQEGSSASFVVADAQTHSFEPGSFDTIVSRFGVMFFDDPVSAFQNLRRAAAPSALLQCIVWRSPADNPFMTTAERAAAPFLPAMPPRKPDEPGQFAFGDRARVERILSESGWSSIAIVPVDVGCTLTEEDLGRYVTRFGPVGRLLGEANDELRARVVEALHAAFASYVTAGVARVDCACWMVGASA